MPDDIDLAKYRDVDALLYRTYTTRRIEIAKSRGYDHEAHVLAVILADEDRIELTHPYNWLTEEEVET